MITKMKVVLPLFIAVLGLAVYMVIFLTPRPVVRQTIPAEQPAPNPSVQQSEVAPTGDVDETVEAILGDIEEEERVGQDAEENINIATEDQDAVAGFEGAESDYEF